ncbi:aminotransferase class IV [Streptomyces virginiae]|uniref:aminotransferase class IV n=1 Tax=Streptomyces virginiae TaxID=1961 RepID=UPI00324BBC34
MPELNGNPFDPSLDMGRPSDAKGPHVLAHPRPAGSNPPPPLTAKTFTFTRDNAEEKHIGLHPQLRLRRDAQPAGFDDAVLVEQDGRISQGGTWNLGFANQSGAVIWPLIPRGPVLLPPIPSVSESDMAVARETP